jgi:hypothetical protein
VDAQPIDAGDLGLVMLALMRIEGTVNQVISLLENEGQDED